MNVKTKGLTAIAKKIRIQLFLWLKKKLGIIRPPTIVPYRGFANSKKLFVAGHVLENRPDFLAKAHDKKRKNIRNMLARYMSTSIPDIGICVEIQDNTYHMRTDEFGYFECFIDLPFSPLPGWIPIHYHIVEDEGHSKTNPSKIEGEALVVDEHDAAFGIISDIDDTVLISYSTKLFRKLRLILTKNAKTRLPFKGVGRFYNALVGERSPNPIFYVSSSEWNLYDFLVDFFETQQLPKGPFLLQKFKSGLLDLIKTGGGNHEHKLKKIRLLMDFYPQLSFVLIGDSSQRDPEIYAEVVKNYPQRVKAIYIRTIGKNKKLDSAIHQMTKQHLVPLKVVKHTDEAYEHAKSIGLIPDV